LNETRFLYGDLITRPRGITTRNGALLG